MSLDNRPRSRRKPLRTYKSPTSESQTFMPHTIGSPSSSSSSKSKLTKGTKLPSRTMDAKKESNNKIIIRCRCPQSPPLPLFHPLGKLAMSLPPLDPTVYGLPVLAVPDGLERRNRRTRTGIAEAVEEEGVRIRQGMSAVAAVAAHERGAPRKRRTGAAGVNKRKRKDVEDGDSTYPAKRTRIPRGQNAGEEETGPDTPIVEAASDEIIEKRRSTRSRAPISKRRGSSDSSGTNTTGVEDRGNNEQKEQDV